LIASATSKNLNSGVKSYSGISERDGGGGGGGGDYSSSVDGLSSAHHFCSLWQHLNTAKKQACTYSVTPWSPPRVFSALALS
jgi:hypothetical protein